MTFNKHKEEGFSLIEMIVALVIFTTSTALTVPIITRNRWQADVDRYALQLESGLYSLRAKLGSRKTSCNIEFPATFSFQHPNTLIEFSKGQNTATFSCCDSQISQLINDPQCTIGHAGNLLSEITANPLDNLRLVQQESTPEAEHVRVAVSDTQFGFTPPGMTAESKELTFLICHEKAMGGITSGDVCIPNKGKLSIRCIQINGSGSLLKGTWTVPTATSPISSGECKRI